MLRRTQQCEEEDKADAAEEERIRVRRMERQQEIMSLEAEREKLGEMVGRMLASIGEELDCDMGMEEGGGESDETNGENNVYDEKEMAGEKETSKETEKAEGNETSRQQPQQVQAREALQ